MHEQLIVFLCATRHRIDLVRGVGDDTNRTAGDNVALINDCENSSDDQRDFLAATHDVGAKRQPPLNEGMR